MELNKIYNEDCFITIGRMIEDGTKCDLVLTSPPYNLGKSHHTGSNHFKAYTDYDDNMPEELYQKWQTEILNECYRVLKKDGSLMYNHKNRIRNGEQIEPYRWLYNTPFVIKQEIVWQNGSQNFDKCRIYPMTERVYWLAKDSKTKLFNVINHHDIFTRAEWQPVKTKGAFKRAYPEKMVEDLISCFPNAKVILDPFSGSGTTCCVAKRMGRDYIGFELSQESCKIAEERLENII